MKLKNKVVVVTGAGGGIGSELVQALLGRGARVAAVDISDKSLVELSQRLGHPKKALSTHSLDITDRKAVHDLPISIIRRHNQVDGLINNAGVIQPFVKVNELEYETIERVMNINFYGTLYMTKAFLPELLGRPEAHIVNVSSMGGFLPVPGQTVYGASKAAVKLLTEGLYGELLDTNVAVSVAFPGGTRTNIAGNSGVDIPNVSEADMEKQESRTLPANKAAEIIIKGIEKNRAQIFTGKDSKLMNKLYRLRPVFAVKLITKQMKDLLAK